MGLVIFDSDTTSYSIVNQNKKEYVEIVKLANSGQKSKLLQSDNKNIENNENSQTTIKRPKKYKKKNKLTKENQEFLNGISGSGFKTISK